MFGRHGYAECKPKKKQLAFLMYAASIQAPPSKQKTIKFQASLRGAQVHKKCPQEHNENIKLEPKSIRMSISVKSWILQ